MRYLIPLLFVFSTITILGQTPNSVELSDLVESSVDSLWRYKRTMEPYTGAVISYWGVTGELIDGRWNGLYREWYENGQLGWEVTYENGKENGLRRWWDENGQLIEEVNYENGEFHGLYREWYENGQLERETNYKDGENNGLERQWYENGQLGWEDNYENGVRNGLYRRWYENGQLKSEWNYDTKKRPYDGRGIDFGNGDILYPGQEIDMSFYVGLYRFWYENGQLSSETNYDENGVRNGLSRGWDKYGNLTRDETWENGVLIEKRK